MPITIYSASLITQRNRDKVIAQEVQNRNSAGVSIITPQSGYGAYTIATFDNGAITDYRKREGCTNVDKACECEALSNTTTSIITPTLEVNIEFTHSYPPPVGDGLVGLGNGSYPEIGIIVGGEGIIDWGDGTVTSFVERCDYYHRYFTDGIFTITLKGKITSLGLGGSQGESSECGTPYLYPNVINMNFINASNLELLYIYPQLSLTTINNFQKCYNTLKSIIISTNCDVFEDLVNIDLLSLVLYNEIPLGNPIFTNLNVGNIWPNLESLGLNNNINMTGITNLPPSLQSLIVSNMASGFTELPSLPASLQSLDVSNMASGFTELPSLPASLQSLNVSNMASGFTELPSLPASLQSLDVSNMASGFTELPSLPASLQSLNVSNMASGFTELPSLPASLQSLDVSYMANTFIIPTLLPSNLKSFNINNNVFISSLLPLPSGLTDLNCEECNINQTNANNIAQNLVDNNQSNGNLVIINQSGGVTITITGSPWTTLISRGWTIE